MSFLLRLYEPSDFEALYALDHQCYARGIAYSRATLRWYLSLRGSETLVAADASAAAGESVAGIIGFIVGEVGGETKGERDRKSGHIITLDVSPEHRREGAGHGAAAPRAFERRLAARGAQLPSSLKRQRTTK